MREPHSITELTRKEEEAPPPMDVPVIYEIAFDEILRQSRIARLQRKGVPVPPALHHSPLFQTISRAAEPPLQTYPMLLLDL